MFSAIASVNVVLILSVLKITSGYDISDEIEEAYRKEAGNGATVVVNRYAPKDTCEGAPGVGGWKVLIGPIPELFELRKSDNKRGSYDGLKLEFDSSQKFRCEHSNHCIQSIKVCDGKEDCPDSSDESIKCREIKCSNRFFRCDYGACVPRDAECDGVQDCADNSDERSSKCLLEGAGENERDQVEENCGPTTFKCTRSHDCIPIYATCDGVIHCKDGSDETPRLCSTNQCPLESFRCRYGACVSKYAPCNGRKDCADNSDEDDPKCRRTTTNKPFSDLDLNACALPNVPDHGKYVIRTAKRGSMFFVSDGSVVSYVCDGNYVLTPNVPHYNCVKGRWSPSQFPTCVRRKQGWFSYSPY